MSIETIRSVHDAAQSLTLACTEIVGPISMTVSLPMAKVIGEPIPRPFIRKLRLLEKRQ